MKVCPTCKRPLGNGPRRICGCCGKPIRRHDRWHFENGRCIHNDCNNPSNQAEKQEVPSAAPLLEGTA